MSAIDCSYLEKRSHLPTHGIVRACRSSDLFERCCRRWAYYVEAEPSTTRKLDAKVLFFPIRAGKQARHFTVVKVNAGRDKQFRKRQCPFDSTAPRPPSGCQLGPVYVFCS